MGDLRVAQGWSIAWSAGAEIDMWHIDGLVQERRNSIALAMGLRIPCTNPSIYCIIFAIDGFVLPRFIVEQRYA